MFLLVSAKTAHRARVESRVGRADNYNAYHKLAVAVAEVWGSAIVILFHALNSDFHEMPFSMSVDVLISPSISFI